MNVDVIVIVDVIGPLIVAVHVNRNATVAVIERGLEIDELDVC